MTLCSKKVACFCFLLLLPIFFSFFGESSQKKKRKKKILVFILTDSSKREGFLFSCVAQSERWIKGNVDTFFTESIIVTGKSHFHRVGFFFFVVAAGLVYALVIMNSSTVRLIYKRSVGVRFLHSSCLLDSSFFYGTLLSLCVKGSARVVYPCGTRLRRMSAFPSSCRPLFSPSFLCVRRTLSSSPFSGDVKNDTPTVNSASSSGSTTSTTASTSFVAVPSPYPVEGGHVPIYSVVRGIVQKRHWIFRNPEWCDLCKEPVAVWANHHGRKDHALMDQHYTALVEFPRRWNPEVVLKTFSEALEVPMEPYHFYFRQYDQQHRNELFSMLKALGEGGMLYFGEPRNTFLHRLQGGLRGMDHQGALVLHHFLLGPLMRLYPDGHIQDFSNLVDFITCAYNMETVYDLCNMYELDEIAQQGQFKATSPAAMGLGGASTSSTSLSGFQQDVLRATGDGGENVSGTSSSLSAESSPSAAAGKVDGRGGSSSSAGGKASTDEEAFSRKAVFVRQLLGQLRWLTLPGEPVHPAGYTFPPHLVTLGEICVKALVVEIIGARICEYMVRAEPVWRSFGFERKRVEVMKSMVKPQDILPKPVVYHYRPMSEDKEDLFWTGPNKVDAELEDEKKGCV